MSWVTLHCLIVVFPEHTHFSVISSMSTYFENKKLSIIFFKSTSVHYLNLTNLLLNLILKLPLLILENLRSLNTAINLLVI